MKTAMMAMMALCAAMVAHADTQIVNGIKWKFCIQYGEAVVGCGDTDDDCLAIPQTTKGSVTIPSKLGGCPVRRIGECAFYGCMGVTSISVPKGVTSIGCKAFYRCAELSSVTLPTGVVVIDEKAFYGCDALKTIAIPEGSKTIGKKAFGYCDRLESVKLPASLEYVGFAAFYYCPSLSKFVMDKKGENFAVMDDMLFTSNGKTLVVGINGCERVMDGVTTIGEAAFYGMNITTITLPTSIERVFDYAFYNESGLKSVIFLGNAPLLAEGEYYDVCHFGYDDGFSLYVSKNSTGWNCEIPGTWNGYSIKYDDFTREKQLGNVLWKFKVADSTATIIGADPANGDLSIPSSLGGCPVTCIADHAFECCDALISVMIPSSVTSIGEDAFGDCDALTTVFVDHGDTARVFGMLDESGLNCGAITFVEDKDPMPIVTFNANGGDVTELVRNVEKGLAVGTLPVPTRSKYKFDGWYTAESGGTKVSPATKVVANVIYYAHWIYDGSAYVGVAVDVECAGKGTVSGGNKNFKAGAKVALKATAKTGYVFAGWFDDSGEPLAGTVDYRTSSYTYVATGEDDVTLYAKFISVTEDFASIGCEVEDEYATNAAIEPIVIDVDSGSLATVKVAGLPTGLKFTAKALDVKATKTTPTAHYEANTIYGTPTKSGVYTATITVTTAGKATATKTVTFTVIDRAKGENFLKVESDSAMGKVTGAGIYAAGKKVTLKATANAAKKATKTTPAVEATVFAGWFADPEFNEPLVGAVDYRTASFTYEMPNEDAIVYAKFAPASEDANITLYADVYEVTANAAETVFNTSGELTLALEAESVTVPKIAISGLPAGLKFTDKQVLNKDKSVLAEPNTIYGTATKPGTYIVTAKLTNTTVKKAIEKKFTIVVDNLTAANDLLYVTDAEGGATWLMNDRSEKYVISVGVTETGLPNILASAANDKVTVMGLPTGLKYDTKTGKITGVATKAGTYTAQI